MKKMGVVFLFIIYSAFFVAPGVSAHTLKVDGNIGVTLHIEPDDAPIAGVESKAFVDINDKSSRFDPANPGNCDCLLHIKQKDQIIKTLPVITSGTFAPLRFTFPESGVYQIAIVGKPNKNGVPFQEFSTTFDFFVKPQGGAPVRQQAKNPLVSYFPYVTGVVGILIVLLFVLG